MCSCGTYVNVQHIIAVHEHAEYSFTLNRHHGSVFVQNVRTTVYIFTKIDEYSRDVFEWKNDICKTRSRCFRKKKKKKLHYTRTNGKVNAVVTRLYGNDIAIGTFFNNVNFKKKKWSNYVNIICCARRRDEAETFQCGAASRESETSLRNNKICIHNMIIWVNLHGYEKKSCAVVHNNSSNTGNY